MFLDLEDGVTIAFDNREGRGEAGKGALLMWRKPKWRKPGLQIILSK